MVSLRSKLWFFEKYGDFTFGGVPFFLFFEFLLFTAVGGTTLALVFVLDDCFAYSGVVFTKTLVGGVLPDGTQRIGRGEVGAQTPLRLPSLPSETSHPPLSSRLDIVQLAAGSYMAESARLSKCADLDLHGCRVEKDIEF